MIGLASAATALDVLSDPSRASVYEHPAYLAASAAHCNAELELLTAAGATLPLLRLPDGTQRTVYGLPRPTGCSDAAAVGELALAIREHSSGRRLAAVLSPLGDGPELARALCCEGARPAGARQIATVSLGLDPAEGFARRARRSLATAEARGARAVVEDLQAWFGGFYRDAMAALGASAVYRFREPYFEALRAVPHFQVTVRDGAGVAAAALFLCDGHEAHYHLGGRRNQPEPVLGAMMLGLATGLQHAHRSGCAIAVLGGGRTDNPDDSLLAFKRQLAPELRTRPEVVLSP